MKKITSIFYWAAFANILILGLPLIAGFSLVFIYGHYKYADSGSPFYYIGIGLMLLGWCFLALSKWDQIRRGDLMSWGVSGRKNQLLYRISYLTIFVGYLICTFSGRL